MSVLPWNIKKFDEGWFILILDKAHEQYLGTRVIAINDVPIDEVVERTRQVISYEADTWLWQKAPDVLGWKEALEYLDIVEPDEPVLVMVETAQGTEETFELPAYDDWSEEKKQEVLVGFQRDSVPVTAEQDAIYWSTALDENTYFIQYNSCKEDPCRWRSLSSRWRRIWKAAATKISSLTCATTAAETARSSGRWSRRSLSMQSMRGQTYSFTF